MARKNRVRLSLEALENRDVPAVFVNEIHYDNLGTDMGEFVEIAGTAGTNLSGWSIALYDGANGLPYFTTALGGVIPNQQNGYGTVVQLFPSELLQNDLGGVAIVDNMGQVVQFVSYEGQFTATGGPAAGLTSQSIGPWEWGTDQPGFSLQLTGTGTSYTDFIWNGATTATPGMVNGGQNFTAPPAPPVISVEKLGDATEGGANGMFRFTRTGDTSQPLVVMVYLSGTATPGSDFSYIPSQVNFAAGTSVATVAVAAIDDTVAEPTETVTLTIQPGGSYTAGTLSAATVNIFDNDSQSPPTVPVISVEKIADATEGGANGTFRFTRTGDVSQALTVNYTVGGTATSGSDFPALPGSFTFAAGQGTYEVLLGALMDGLHEGEESVLVTIQPNANYSSSATAALAVIDRNPPVAVGDVIVVSNGPFSFTPLANDTDPDGDTLSLTAADSPANGTVVLSGGSVTYTPHTGYIGPDAFEYWISDGHGGTDSAYVYVDVTQPGGNHLPEVIGDHVETLLGQPVIISVLANDFDIDGNSLSVTTVAPPEYGTASLGGDGAVTYTPAAGYTGLDAFEYTVSDGAGGTSSAVVVVDVLASNANAAPVGAGDSARTLPDQQVSIDVLWNDTDADFDTLVITGHTQPSHGTVTQAGADTFIYTPASGYVGIDTFTYNISDGNGGFGVATVTVTVAPNTSPQPADDLGRTVGQTLSIAALSNDSDPDGDTLVITSVGAAAHGTVTFTADTLTYTPAPGYVGGDTFTYTVSDGKGGSATALVAIVASDVWITADQNANEDTERQGWFTIHRSQTAGEQTVQYAAPTGVATIGTDYTGPSSGGGTVTFADGQAEIRVFITPIRDGNDAEPLSETVTLALLNQLVPLSATLRLIDNKGPVVHVIWVEGTTPSGKPEQGGFGQHVIRGVNWRPKFPQPNPNGENPDAKGLSAIFMDDNVVFHEFQTVLGYPPFAAPDNWLPATLHKDAGRKLITEVDKLRAKYGADVKYVIAGYSWGAYAITKALEMAFFAANGKPTKPYTKFEAVFLVDPVIGWPNLLGGLSDLDKPYSTGKSKDNTGMEFKILTGNYSKGFDWYQQVDDKGSLPPFQLRGRPMDDDRFTNTEYKAADFPNAEAVKAAHTVIVTNKAIRDAMEAYIKKLLGEMAN